MQTHQSTDNHLKRSEASEIAGKTSEIVKNLISAFRIFSLYPENHVLVQNSLSQIFNELQRYTEDIGSLILFFNRSGIVSENKVIFKIKDDDNTFTGPLLRDGISALEFRKDIDINEIKSFFHILKKNRNISEDASTDTVTDLWEADLKNVYFSSSDILFELENQFSFPKLSAAFPSPPEIKVSQGIVKNNGISHFKKHDWIDYDPSFYKPANLNSSFFDGINLSFHPDELKQLEIMVKEQESGIYEDDLVDLLLFVLGEADQTEDIKAVFSGIADEFGRVLKTGGIYKAYSIYEKTAVFHSRHKQLKPFIDNQFKAFLSHISGPVFQSSLSGLIHVFENNDSGNVFFIKKLFNVLDSTATISLCNIINDLRSAFSRELALDIVKNKARYDSKLIDRMMNSSDSSLVHTAIAILKKKKNANSDYMLRLALKHQSEHVRSSALDYFLEKPNILNSIFFLIDDPSHDIRYKLLKNIESKRSLASETLMIQYLDSYSDNIKNKRHILNCYKTLGKCGSERSLLFLKQKLFDGAWADILSKKSTIYRQGALLALSEIGSVEAEKIIKKAAKSRSPLIRSAYAAAFTK